MLLLLETVLACQEDRGLQSGPVAVVFRRLFIVTFLQRAQAAGRK